MNFQIRSVIQDGFHSNVCEVLKLCPANSYTETETGQATLTSSSGSAIQSFQQQDMEYIQTDTKLANRQGSDALTFVQLSDIHLDKGYREVGLLACC